MGFRVPPFVPMFYAILRNRDRELTADGNGGPQKRLGEDSASPSIDTLLALGLDRYCEQTKGVAGWITPAVREKDSRSDASA